VLNRLTKARSVDLNEGFSILNDTFGCELNWLYSIQKYQYAAAISSDIFSIYYTILSSLKPPSQ